MVKTRRGPFGLLQLRHGRGHVAPVPRPAAHFETVAAGAARGDGAGGRTRTARGITETGASATSNITDADHGRAAAALGWWAHASTKCIPAAGLPRFLPARKPKLRVASMAWRCRRLLRAIEPTRSPGRRRVDGLTARRRRPGLSTAWLPAELSSSKSTVAAGRACISSAARISSARRFRGHAVRATDGAGAGAGAFSETVAVARAVAAAATAWGLRGC